MTNIDQFESVFKAADKTPLALEPVSIREAMVLTGLDRGASGAFDERAKRFLGSMAEGLSWQLVSGDEYGQVGDLVDLVRRASPDVICTYRNLRTPAPDYPYSLGVFVEVLTQATSVPVMLLPNPARLAQRDGPDRRRSVMAITDRLTGDHRLVSYAARFTEPQGTLFLSHVEDAATFERYLDTIAKIPSIDTESARETILEQLLKEPRDYIDSCRRVLHERGYPLNVEEVVTVGHHLTDHKRLLEEREIDLAVLNTKDEDQLAMHGLAYPLAVEMRDTPLLLV